jgi:hypothetical protein
LRDLLQRFQHLPLSQQLALTVSACCLIATCTLVAVSARSNQFVQEALLSEYGEAVAQQLARKLANELMTEDRLAVTAELTRVAELAAISRATAEAVDGARLADVGQHVSNSLVFSAPILIDGNTAGEVRIEVDPTRQSEARRQMVFALAGLSLLLSIAVYGISRPFGQRLARRINRVTDQLAEVVDVDHTSDNELARLQHRMEALPLDLLKPRGAAEARDEHYDDTAVLYVALKSLPGYVDTLDGPRLHRYVALVHRLVFGAAGFYGGQLEVVRQFGLAVYFSGQHKVGSPALRAASCAWLLQQSVAPAEEVIRLSLRQGLAIGISELGPGDGRDIYPGLYTQATLDELRELAEGNEEALLLTRDAAQDVDLATRMKVEPVDDHTALVNDLADGHRDLLERQLQIMLKAVLSDAEAREPPSGGLSPQNRSVHH